MKILKKNQNSQVDGVVAWYITYDCNYKCSYCFLHKSKLQVENHEAFLKNIRKKIPKNWKFYIIAEGEPFIHPHFFEIIDGLVKSGYRLSITTNLSASLYKLKKFFKITGDNLDYFHASFHLE
jgi:MoaA/NifB/PqqE/SkfB family radical SAM enzyme